MTTSSAANSTHNLLNLSQIKPAKYWLLTSENKTSINIQKTQSYPLWLFLQIDPPPICKFEFYNRHKMVTQRKLLIALVYTLLNVTFTTLTTQNMNQLYV